MKQDIFRNLFKEKEKKIAVTTELFETKYLVPRRMRNVLLSLLRQKTKVPAKFSYAHMRTFYFDDRHSTSLSDSVDGNLKKRKYRLREYINPEEGGAFYSLEVKLKNEAVIRKIKRLIYWGFTALFAGILLAGVVS